MREVSEQHKIIELFKPAGNKAFPVRNHFVRAATWLGLCDDKTGRLTPAAISRQAEAAAGGAGTVISEFAYVSKEGKGAPRQWGLDTEEAVPEVRQLADAVHKTGAKLVVQLAHAGAAQAQAPEEEAISPSGLPYPGNDKASRAMTAEDIKKTISDFAAAAARVKAGGADAVELHDAHGYLPMQFLSPIFNRRTDEYGGSEENRRRFLLELYRAVREAVGPDFPVWAKLSMTEGKAGGYTGEEGVRTALALLNEGLDAVEVSSGAPYSDSDYVPCVVGVSAGDSEAPSAKYALELKKKAPAESLIILTGGLRSLPVMAALLEDGVADLFGISRPFIAEPDLINRWAEEDSRPSACVSCNACARGSGGLPVSCPIMRDRQEGEWDPL